MPKTTENRLVCLTGGGTAGHVMPHLAVWPLLEQAGYQAYYIGSQSIEKNIIEATTIPFYRISSGKLRRYISIENIIDVFRVVLGTLQAFLLLVRKRPRVVFSKGGFVSVPVCLAARILGIPVVTHESDYTPGLANRIIAKVADKILFAFPDTEKFLPKVKSKWVGLPVRPEVFAGDRLAGLQLCAFSPSSERKTILVMGGSLGALRLNQAIQEILPELVETFNVVHLTGKGKLIDFSSPHYRAFEYLSDRYADVLAAADLVICRAGANSIFELLAMRKPMLLIPLVKGSRGDQVDNAKLFSAKGWALTLGEEKLNAESLGNRIYDLANKAPEIQAAQSGYDGKGAAAKIAAELLS